MNSSSSSKGHRFLQRVKAAGEPNVTVMASPSRSAVLSQPSARAAQSMIGGLPSRQAFRVTRLAAKLDKLVAADVGGRKRVRAVCE